MPADGRRAAALFARPMQVPCRFRQSRQPTSGRDAAPTCERLIITQNDDGRPRLASRPATPRCAMVTGALGDDKPSFLCDTVTYDMMPILSPPLLYSMAMPIYYAPR